MLASTTSLFVITFVLTALAGHFAELETDPLSSKSAISTGISNTFGIAALAAFIAAIITLFLPSVAAEDTAALTLRELNAHIDAASIWLKKSWILTLFICVSLLSWAWYLGREVSNETAKRAGQVVKGVSTIKLMFGILAACTFVGGNAYEENVGQLPDLQKARTELKEAQLQLFSETQALLLSEAVSDAVKQASQTSTAFAMTQMAYNDAGKYSDPPDIPVLEEAIVQVPSKLRESLGATPDLSMAQVDSANQRIDEATMELSKDNPLVANIVDVALEKSAAGPLKEHFMSFHNPFLDKLVANVIDPIFLKPLQKRLTTIASKWMTGQIEAKAAIAQARATGRPYGGLFVNGVEAGSPQFGNEKPFGIAEWNQLRLIMADQIKIGINKSADVQEEARKVEVHFTKARNSIQILNSNLPDREMREERAFQQYLRHNPRFSALWSFFVIIATPERLKPTLKEISLARIRRGKARDLRQLLHENPKDGRIAAASFGLTPEKMAQMKDSEIARNIYESHGEYPADGYLLYFTDTAPNEFESAEKYFESEEVGQKVVLFCPS